MDITTLRNMMKNAVTDYLNDPSLSNILFLHTFPGSGKTYTTVNTLIDDGFIFVYSAPTHKLGEESVARPYDILQMKSRRHFCTNANLVELSRLGINSSLVCDTFCNEKDVCEYYLRIRELFSFPQSWVGVHHHLNNLVPSYLREHNDCNDCVVIDEEFLQSLYVNFTIGQRLLSWTVGFLNRVDECPESELVLWILKELVFAIQTGRSRDIDYDQIKSDIIDYGDRFRFRDMDEFLNIVDRELIGMFLKGKRIYRNIIRPLFEMAKDYYHNREKPGYLESMINLIYSKRTDRFLIFFHRYDLNSVRFDTQKIIVLDATTPVEIYERVFNRPIQTIQYGSVDSAKTYQFSGFPTRNRYPMSSLVRFREEGNTYTGAFHRLLNITRGIVKKHKNDNILIVSRKKHNIKETIYDELVNDGHSCQIVDLKTPWDETSRVAVGHFGGLRGQNDFQNFNVAVIFGAPFPHPDYVRRQSVLLGIGEERLTELNREMEIVQDLYRIRPHGKDDPHFYVLTSVDIGMKITRKYSPKGMENWVHGKKARTITRVGTLKNVRTNIVDVMKQWEEVGKNQLRELVKGANKTIDETIREMEKEGILQGKTKKKEGRGRPGKIYTLNWQKLKQNGNDTDKNS